MSERKTRHARGKGGTGRSADVSAGTRGGRRRCRFGDLRDRGFAAMDRSVGTKPEQGWRRARRPTPGGLFTLAFFAPIATGCISNEYVIPREELRRLTRCPPEQRGQQVHVIQDLGSRRMDAIPTDGPNWPQAEPWPQPYVEPPPPEAETETRDTDVQLGLHGNIYIDGGHHHPAGGNSPPARRRAGAGADHRAPAPG